ncbi:MAG: hypothetical protein ACRELE_00620, partial [Gemmatimonadales bacterium]
LDAFLTESSSPLAASHVATCSACADMVARDRRLVAALAALPDFGVGAEFSNRIIAQVAVSRAPVAIVAGTSTPRSVAARHRAIGAVLVAGGGVAAGFLWASAHPADALRWSSPALHDVGHTLWLALQTIMANATEQPWFSLARDTLATPVHVLIATAGIAAAYAIGLVGLRRLMSEPASHAGW